MGLGLGHVAASGSSVVSMLVGLLLGAWVGVDPASWSLSGQDCLHDLG